MWPGGSLIDGILGWVIDRDDHASGYECDILLSWAVYTLTYTLDIRLDFTTSKL